jgi:deoxyribodipyrimidine photo-lyase
MIDAAMRELYVTGRMHNRARMLVASYLTKHLMTDWRVGEAWFRETLVDWDPASNAMGWQWAAGSGPDAAPFFRIFNPASQAEKFDPEGRYRGRWLAEGARRPHPDALSFFDAAPRSWGLSASAPYPKPLIDLKTGRERALAAYEKLRSAA